MTTKLALILGESTGLKSFYKLYKLKSVNIKYLMCSDKKYQRILKTICKKKGIKYFDNIDYILQKNFKCDFLLSIHSKIILSKNHLKKLSYNCINFHPAILPYYPGLNAISGMIFNQEKFIGVTTHRMSQKIDSGNIIFVNKKKISPSDNLITCTKKIANLTIISILKFIKVVKNNQIRETKNQTFKKKKFPKKIPNKGKLDFNWNIENFKRHFNAGFSGPFKSEWGKVFFYYKKKRKVIQNYTLVKKKNLKNFRIKKIKKDEFIIKLRNNFIKVDTE